MSDIDPKILGKIKKCLALSGSSNPNEAATALRQAHALMAKHGVSTHEITMADKLKAMGVRPGVPDFRLPRRSGCWTGLVVELKSPTGTVSGAQDEWLKALSEEGYLIAVCRTIAEFESIIQRFLAAAHSPRLAPN